MNSEHKHSFNQADNKKQLSRFLYPIIDIKTNIVYHCISKKSFTTLEYWVCEYFHSGYFIESWEWMETIYFGFYSMSSLKLGEKIGNLYKKWKSFLSILSSISRETKKVFSLSPEKICEYEKKQFELLEDILFCYRNMFIREHNSLPFQLFNGIHKANYLKKTEKTQNIDIKEYLKHVPVKSKGKPSKKIQGLSKYYDEKTEYSNETTTDKNQNIQDLFHNVTFIRGLYFAFHKKKFANIYYLFNYLLSKNLGEIGKELFLEFLSVYLEYFGKKKLTIVEAFSDFGIIVKLNNMKLVSVWGFTYIISLMINQLNCEEPKKIKKREMFVKLNDVHKELYLKFSQINLFQDRKTNYNGSICVYNGDKQVVSIEYIDPHKVLKKYILGGQYDEQNINTGILKVKNMDIDESLKDIFLQYKFGFTIEEIQKFIINLPYLDEKWREEQKSQFHKKELMLFNDNSIINIIKKNLYYYHWLWLCSETPIWRCRIDFYKGKFDIEQMEYIFGDDDQDLLEKFWNAYNYEPDEQPRKIQELNMGNIFNE